MLSSGGKYRYRRLEMQLEGCVCPFFCLFVSLSPCLVVSCLVLSCRAVSLLRLVLSCLVVSCLVVSYLALSCLVLSCLCLFLTCLIVSCLALFMPLFLSPRLLLPDLVRFFMLFPVLSPAGSLSLSFWCQKSQTRLSKNRISKKAIDLVTPGLRLELGSGLKIRVGVWASLGFG